MQFNFWHRLLAVLLLCAGLSPVALAVDPSAQAQEAGKAATAAIKKKTKTATAATTPAAEVVTVGMYLNDVQNIDMRANNYLLDFYLWFKWKNEEIDPSTTFEFMNHSESWATIIGRPTEKPEKLPDGTLYQVLHIQGRMSDKMDLRAYPFDVQNLLVLVEDSARDVNNLRYEIESVTVNPSLKIPGFEYLPPSLRSATYVYPTNFGDTRMAEAGQFSRIEFNLPIYRNVLTSFVKNILPIWLAVLCGVFALMLNPKLIDSRFQIAIFSILSLVALQISNGNDLPALQYMNLMDALYVSGYVFLIFLMAELIVATRWAESSSPGDHQRAIRLDRVFGFIAFGLFLASNLWMIFRTFASHS